MKIGGFEKITFFESTNFQFNLFFIPFGWDSILWLPWFLCKNRWACTYVHMYYMYSYIIFFFLLGIKNIPRKEKPDCGRINYLAKSSGMFWHVHVFKVERYNNLRFRGKRKGFRNRLWYLLLVHSTAQFLSYTWWYGLLTTSQSSRSYK